MNKERNVSIVDLFWNSVFHWRLMLVLLAAGLLTCVALISASYKTANTASDSIGEPMGLSSKELSSKERWEVEKTAELCSNYLESKREFDASKETMTTTERVEASRALGESFYHIRAIVNAMTDPQRDALFPLSEIEKEQKAQEKEDAQEKEEIQEKEDVQENRHVAYVVIVMFFLFLHFVFCSGQLLLSKKILLVDCLSNSLDYDLIHRTIYCDVFNKKSSIDRTILSLWVGDIPKTTYQDNQEIAADQIVQAAVANDFKSVAIIDNGCKEQAEELYKLITNSNKGIVSNCVRGLVDNLSDFRTVLSSDSAVILSKVNETNRGRVINEIQTLTRDKITVLDVITYYEL